MEKVVRDKIKKKRIILEKNRKVLGKIKVTRESQLVSKKEKRESIELKNFKENIKNKFVSKKTEKLMKQKVDLKGDKQNTKIQKKKNNIQRKKRRRNKGLKKKLTENRAAVERVLSKGEASPGFNTVSSIDSKLNFKNFYQNSSDCELDLNIIVQKKKFKRSNGRTFNWEDRSNCPVKYYNRSEHLLGKYTNQRQDGCRSDKQSEHWQRDNEDSQYRFYKNKGWLRESEYFHFSRERIPPNLKWSNYSSLSSGSTYSDESGRSRGNECRSLRGRQTGQVSRSRHSRSTEQDYRSRGSRSPGHKVRKTELRSFGSACKSESNFNRNLPPDATMSLPKSSSTSIWERLGDFASQERLKKDHLKKKYSRVPLGSLLKKKEERIAFLVELEKKLRETANKKNIKKGASVAVKDQQGPPGKVIGSTLVLEPKISQKVNHQECGFSGPNVSEVYTMSQPPMMPTMSLENLPLVPGPSGLPVHVAVTGEQIPHDVDGRRIPIGPDGFYLPLDPTGRLFAHIISPGNDAVPIHITEDGVLRLPNSEPVSYGPSHNLPVNVDGSVIFLGLNSKPLTPCPNFPRQPPVEMTPYSAGCFLLTQVQEETSTVLHVPEIVDGSKTIEIQLSNQLDISQPSTENPSLISFIQIPCTKVSTTSLLTVNQKRASEESTEVLQRKEMEKNLGVCPSTGEIARSPPTKRTQGKTSRDECCSEMIIDSSGSNSSDPKAVLETKKGSLDDVFPLALEHVENIMKTTCGNDSPQPALTDSKSEDFIVKKIEQTLKILSEKDFKPPRVGRFILSSLTADLVVQKPSNLSPLLRDRTKLPFLTPNATNCRPQGESEALVESAVNFKFLEQEKSSEKGEKAGSCKNNCSAAKSPVVTFDFGMQCDFTSAVTNNLSSKITDLEMEVVRLRNINANLVGALRNIQGANEK